jgi:hypothetical protein
MPPKLPVIKGGCHPLYVNVALDGQVRTTVIGEVKSGHILDIGVSFGE